MSTRVLNSIRSIYNHDCKRCDLHKDKITVCVPGRGGFKEKILFIAEAPGDTEDKKGETLVGRAGGIFDKLTLSVGMMEDDYYCTNIVKCRPPGNRKPTTREIQRCRVYLNREINQLKPDWIVLMGASAIKAFFGNSATLKNYRSRVVDWNGYNVFSTYHPSLVNYDPHAMALIASDFDILVRHLNGTKPEEVEYEFSEVNKRYRSHIRSLREYKRLSFDIEATGLDPYESKYRVLSVAFSAKAGTAYGMLLAHRRSVTDSYSILKELDEQIFSQNDTESPLLIGHNVKYDLLGLRSCGIVYKGRIADTMVMNNLLDENNLDKSLESLVLRYTTMGNIKERTKDAFKKGSQEEIPVEDLLTRNCADADGTFRLYVKFLKQIKEEGMYPLHLFQSDVVKMLVDVEWEGWLIHKKNMRDLREDYRIRLRKKQKEINTLIGYEINLNSAPQKADLIYNKLKCPEIKVDEWKKKGKIKKHPSTAKNILKMLLWKAEGKVKRILEAMLEASTIGKRYTFFDQVERNIKLDGRVHARYFQTKGEEDEDLGEGGTVTGRLSCKDPNIQQIPREGDIKRIFRSKWKEGRIVQLDYSQMELRVLAEISGDRKMLAIFESGDVDIHTRVASWVYRKPESSIDPKERKFTKQVNFGIAYMIGKYGLAKKLSEVAGEIVTEKYAQKLIDQWFEMFPGVKSFINKTRVQIIREGEIATLFGRKRHLAETNPSTSKGREGIRQGVNFTIQSLASDITLYRAVDFWKWLGEEELKSKIVALVHDAVIVDSPESEVKKVIKAMKRIFENNDFTEDFGFKMKCPLEIEIKTGPTWGDLEKLNG